MFPALFVLTVIRDSEIDLKMVLLGNSAVGKTSVLHKLVVKEFSETSYATTIGVDYVCLFIDHVLTMIENYAHECRR